MSSSPGTGAAPLDDAVSLVLSSHPVLAAGREELRAQARQRDWSADLTLGWTKRGTAEGGAAGPNAGLRVSIPLFDRAHELATARAGAGLRRSESEVLKAFLADAEALAAKAARVEELDILRRFYRDRLEYRKRQVDEGLAEADALWAEAEQVQKAEQDYRREVAGLKAARERVAREHGGERWTALLDLLVEHTNRNAP